MIHHADVLDALRAMPDNSFHGCLTDPPYGLSFMGHQWDHGVPSAEVWREVLRVLRPGAHLLAFGGTRTFHRLTCAIEDAGFEVRDCLMWLYGSGFPKSHDVSKALDRDAAAGATEAARQWAGHGTALKPAWEPIIVARKPLEGTVAQNVQRWGCGALAIDASRVGHSEPAKTASRTAPRYSGRTMANGVRGGEQPAIASADPLGRWPANVILGEEAGAALDAQSGTLQARGNKTPSTSKKALGAVYGKYGPASSGPDSGGASRFFKQCDFSQDEVVFSRAMAMLDACNFDHASIANAHSSQSKPRVVSALSDVVTLASRGETRLLGWTAPFTTATPSESKTLSASLIATILSFDEGSSQGQQRERSFPTGSRASVVQPQKQTGTTTITISHWRSDGSAEPVTFSTTPLNSGHGEAGSSRFMYCAKASRKERDAGLEDFALGNNMRVNAPRKSESEKVAPSSRNVHPTVKPLALTTYLARLILPPVEGARLLVPFCGSGSEMLGGTRAGWSHVEGIDSWAVAVDIARARTA